jgi:hypothetical protein
MTLENGYAALMIGVGIGSVSLSNPNPMPMATPMSSGL